MNLDTNKRITTIKMRVDIPFKKIYALGFTMIDHEGIEDYIEHDLESAWPDEGI